ncbi:MAG: hypothetical protein K0Q66_9 [Chitinophagaceae bacterium]|nr:hypothetical protein [Chitinophagaceae bacterium]
MADNNSSTRNCLSCDKQLHGRIDKKFCNDYCRNMYNNAMRNMNSTPVRNINSVLSKNRRILEALLGEEKTTRINREQMLRKGFNFQYITHTYTNRNGDTYCYCYEMGYLPLENESYLLVRHRDRSADPSLTK